MPDWQSTDLCAGLKANQWTSRSVEVPAEALVDEADVWATVTHVRRDPEAPGDRRDQRIDLEVAVASASVLE